MQHQNGFCAHGVHVFKACHRCIEEQKRIATAITSTVMAEQQSTKNDYWCCAICKAENRLRYTCYRCGAYKGKTQ